MRRRNKLRLWCRFFYVDARLRQRNGRWLASADTPYGPSLGWGVDPDAALRMALQPFDGLIDELLATAPEPWKALGVGPKQPLRAVPARGRSKLPDNAESRVVHGAHHSETERGIQAAPSQGGAPEEPISA